MNKKANIVNIVFIIVAFTIVFAIGMYSFDYIQSDTTNTSEFYNITSTGLDIFSTSNILIFAIIIIFIIVLFFAIIKFLVKSGGGNY